MEEILLGYRILPPAPHLTLKKASCFCSRIESSWGLPDERLILSLVKGFLKLFLAVCASSIQQSVVLVDDSRLAKVTESVAISHPDTGKAVPSLVLGRNERLKYFPHQKMHRWKNALASVVVVVCAAAVHVCWSFSKPSIISYGILFSPFIAKRLET